MTTYRTSGDWGTGKGANLTHAEVDTNFNEVSVLADTVESATLSPVGVSDISIEDNALTISLSDGSEKGPYILPAPKLTNRGTFIAGYPYQVGDLFNANDNVFLVIQGFVSAETFNSEDTLSGEPIVVPVLGAPIYTEAQMFFPGQPDVGVIGQYVAGRDMVLDKINAYFGTAPDSEEIYSIRKSGVDIGFITFEADENIGVIGLSGGSVTLVAGDRISIHNVLYGTGRDMSATFRFSRKV